MAHSQGAAITYDALRRLIDHGWQSSTTSLISYGSGLRRLVSLEQAFANPRIWNVSALACQALVIIEWAAVLWMFNGDLSILAALTIVIAAIIVNAAQLGAASDAHASHDPVSAAGTEVKSEAPYLELALQLAGRDDQTLAGRFYRNQRVVTNQQSQVFDHTSYWRAADDFVASVAATLLRAASMPVSRGDD